MRPSTCLLVCLIACVVSVSAQDAAVMAPSPAAGPDRAMAPAPAPVTSAPADESASSSPPPYYPPKPSVGTWFSWAPEDPLLVAGLVFAFVSATGFLFVIWAVFFELIVGPLFMSFVDQCAQKRK